MTRLKILKEMLADLGIVWEGEHIKIEDPRALMARLAERLNPKPAPETAPFFASEGEVDPRKIEPELELVQTSLQHRILRHAMSFWSVPVTRGVGRQLAYIVWDRGHGKVMGVFTLASPVIGLAVRDRFIGWQRPRYQWGLCHIMTATVLGAVPPYNAFLGAKLVALLAGADEVRETYYKRYGDELVMVDTMGAFGKSVIYNRLRGWRFVGYTKGYALQHLYAPEVHEWLKSLLDEEKLRKIRACSRKRFAFLVYALREAGVQNPDVLMATGIKRGYYIYPLAHNWLEFLRGEADQPIPIPRPADVLIQHWKERWLVKRLLNGYNQSRKRA